MYKSRCKKVLGKGDKKRVKRSIGGCAFCKVPLCQEGSCWSRYHSNDANYFVKLLVKYYVTCIMGVLFTGGIPPC